MFGIVVPLSRGIHFFYEQCIAPRSADEDVRRKELILNVILAVLLSILLCLTVITLRNSLRPTDYGVNLVKFSGLTLFFVGLYVLARHGFVKPVSYLLVILLSVSVAYASYRWGIGLPSALLFYGLIVSIASILISSRFALLLSIVFVSFIVDRGLIESQIGALPAWRTQPILPTDGVQYAFVILLTTVVSLLASREIDKSLERARRSERELKEKNDTLEAAVEERTRRLKLAQVEKMSSLYRFVEFGRLSSGVFHDILNPLSAMTSTVNDLAVTLRFETPAVTEKIDEAIRASRRMERFVDSVRKQIQAHSIDSVFSANEEVEEALTLFEYSARARHIMIEFLADEPVCIRGNPLKVQQVVTNLVSNALDSYDSLARDGSSVVVIAVKGAGGRMELSVRDHGCGIEKGLVEKIFDPFFTTKEEHRGIGLGLSTTKHIVESDFQGTITVKSAPAAGSAFIVSIPRIFVTLLEAISPHEEDSPRHWIDASQKASREGSSRTRAREDRGGSRDRRQLP